MLVEPRLCDLMEFVDSKYTLVSVSAKRARSIMEKYDILYDNPVSMALKEIAEGDITWERFTPIEDEEGIEETAEITNISAEDMEHEQG